MSTIGDYRKAAEELASKTISGLSAFTQNPGLFTSALIAGATYQATNNTSQFIGDVALAVVGTVVTAVFVKKAYSAQNGAIKTTFSILGAAFAVGTISHLVPQISSLVTTGFNIQKCVAICANAKCLYAPIEMFERHLC